MPDFEYWITGYAVIPAAGLFFALVLGALGVGPVLTRSSHRRMVWAGVAIIAALTWWQLAKKEEENAKPEHDYAYLIPSNFTTSDGQIILTTIATGTLRNVRIAARRVGPDGKPEAGYVYSNGIEGVIVDADGNLSQVALPVGFYVLDVDPPTKFGKVTEWLRMEKTDHLVGYTILVTRKGSGEVLVPPPKPIFSLREKLLLLFFCGQFFIFASTLAWASWIES